MHNRSTQPLSRCRLLSRSTSPTISPIRGTNRPPDRPDRHHGQPPGPGRRGHCLEEMGDETDEDALRGCPPPAGRREDWPWLGYGSRQDIGMSSSVSRSAEDRYWRASRLTASSAFGGTALFALICAFGLLRVAISNGDLLQSSGHPYHTNFPIEDPIFWLVTTAMVASTMLLGLIFLGEVLSGRGSVACGLMLIGCSP